jgi:hypothetical protein
MHQEGHKIQIQIQSTGFFDWFESCKLCRYIFSMQNQKILKKNARTMTQKEFTVLNHSLQCNIFLN